MCSDANSEEDSRKCGFSCNDHSPASDCGRSGANVELIFGKKPKLPDTNLDNGDCGRSGANVELILGKGPKLLDPNFEKCGCCHCDCGRSGANMELIFGKKRKLLERNSDYCKKTKVAGHKKVKERPFFPEMCDKATQTDFTLTMPQNYDNLFCIELRNDAIVISTSEEEGKLSFSYNGTFSKNNAFPLKKAGCVDVAVQKRMEFVDHLNEYLEKCNPRDFKEKMLLSAFGYTSVKSKSDRFIGGPHHSAVMFGLDEAVVSFRDARDAAEFALTRSVKLEALKDQNIKSPKGRVLFRTKFHKKEPTTNIKMKGYCKSEQIAAACAAFTLEDV